MRNPCPFCGRSKMSFISRSHAKQWASRRKGFNLRAYRCGPVWHLTSMHAADVAMFRRIGKWDQPELAEVT